MNKITNFVSVRHNGKIRPEDHLPDNFYELDIQEFWTFWGNEIAKRWLYQGQTFEVDFKSRQLEAVYLLPDQTGFIAIDGNPGKHAYILNGDATVRFVLTPAFNMRGFDTKRLAVVRQHDEERAKLSGRMLNTVMSREEQTCFHNIDTSDGKLEIFGDDGLGDCYYTYDWNTGELLSTRTLPRRS
jgi:hypothetical protein